MPAFDALVLGPFIFSDFSPPDEMTLATKQQVVKHQMPGGYRTVDVMGPDDEDPAWSGVMYGEDAFSDMLTLYSMCQAGQELAFSWGAEARTVVITEFSGHVVKEAVVKYSIKLMYVDDSGSGSQAGASMSLESMVLSDLNAALAF
jgi:hypothetical protein